jgi:hypothetical protein
MNIKKIHEIITGAYYLLHPIILSMMMRLSMVLSIMTIAWTREQHSATDVWRWKNIRWCESTSTTLRMLQNLIIQG